MTESNRFVWSTPNAETCWRSIVLFGRNVASYKFALAESLISVAPKHQSDIIRLEEIAPVFADAICRHLKDAPKQSTANRSTFIEACRSYNSGILSRSERDERTVRYGFQDVIDAFHVVSHDDVPVRFFSDERKVAGGLRLTDDFRRLMVSCEKPDLSRELEARWKLVEFAWSHDISQRLLSVDGSADDLRIVSKSSSNARVSLTSAKDALNGYQKGKCFYCFRTISIESASPDAADVDHFFPKCLNNRGFERGNIDGIWNLVLACVPCNRGAGGKFERMPSQRHLERLVKRNEYFVGSHHPLRETIIAQTGRTEEERGRFLSEAARDGRSLLIHTWSPASEADGAF